MIRRARSAAFSARPASGGPWSSASAMCMRHLDPARRMTRLGEVFAPDLDGSLVIALQLEPFRHEQPRQGKHGAVFGDGARAAEPLVDMTDANQRLPGAELAVRSERSARPAVTSSKARAAPAWSPASARRRASW